jgi:5-methylcytosine-specific restriction protein A
MRSLPEWMGSTPDATIPPRVRLRVFENFEGICQCGCGTKIAPGMKWQLDHIIALINGGLHSEINLHPLLVDCHKRKTKDDVAIKTYNYKRRLAHAGIRRRKSRPMPGSRQSAWKVTFGRFGRGVARR